MGVVRRLGGVDNEDSRKVELVRTRVGRVGVVGNFRVRALLPLPTSSLTKGHASPANAKRIPLDSLYEDVKSSLLSHSRSLRLQTLRLLNSLLVDVPESTSYLLKKILQAEEISIDVQGVRERVLRITRLPVSVKDSDVLGADICARWLIGTCPFLRSESSG